MRLVTLNVNGIRSAASKGLFRWLEKQGGLAKMEALNAAKAKLIYDAIDGSGGWYKGTVCLAGIFNHGKLVLTGNGENGV